MHEHCGQKGFKTISDLFILRVFLLLLVCNWIKSGAHFDCDIPFVQSNVCCNVLLRVIIFFYVECASYKTNAVFHDIEFCAHCVRNHFMPPDFLCKRTQNEEFECAGLQTQPRLALPELTSYIATLSSTASGLGLTL